MRIDRKTLSGGTLLLILNILFATGFFIYENYLEPEPDIDADRFSLPDDPSTSDENEIRPDSLFPFDPNELGKEGWKKLGLSEDEANVLLKYRKSGARFYNEKDLLEVYSIGKEELEAWEAHLRFPDPGQKEDGSFSGGEDGKKKEEGDEQGKEPDPFPFDPNRISRAEWEKLGLSSQQAEVVMRYRRSGGKFWEASDLLDLYVVDTGLYRKWKEYVRIDREALKVPIDRADKKELSRLPGIGKARAGRIVEYRDLLGGFHAAEQLEEVYGIPDSVLRRVRPRIRIEGDSIVPLHLDTTAARLMRHPYIDPETAERIQEYRDRYGPFEKKEELLEMDLFNDEEYRKIAPYLRLSVHER